MYLFVISKRFYTVCATGRGPDHCELLGFLQGLGSNLQKDCDRMLALFEKVALTGPPRNMEISHQLKDKLFEFIQGRLRVLWFYDEGRIIICTSGFIKKGQKTPRNEMEHAIQIMNEYFEDKRRGEIKICEEEVIR